MLSVHDQYMRVIPVDIDKSIHTKIQDAMNIPVENQKLVVIVYDMRDPKHSLKPTDL
jgi:major membrane immunogen (membrane-anchored lipoprotein)